jgi:hypothetical protein
VAEVKVREELAKTSETALLERGDIVFLYRPRVGHDEAHGLEDVERFYMLLKPWQRQVFRLILLGRKRLPDPEEHDRFWAFVWRVFTNRKALNDELGEQEYATKTRGIRKVAAARPAAEGIYAIARHGGHTHLAYAIELPTRRGPAERDLNIEREASYIIAVKNPQAPSPPNAGLAAHEQAQFPKSLQDKFEGRRFLPVDPPDFLDHEGAELMLIGARENPEQELGIAFEPDKEGAHHADVFKILKLPRDVAREPLFEGRWK